MNRNLPLDRSREFNREDYPASPKSYEPLDHFVQRYHDDERFLDRDLGGVEAVRRIITRGNIRNNDDGCGCFVLDWHGVYYYLVVGFHDKGYRVAVSGWPIVRDEERAIDSGYWLREELTTIDEFNEKHFGESFSKEWDEYVEWSMANPQGGLQ